MQMLNWASRFNISVFLDNQDYDLPYHSYDGLLAAGAIEYVRASAGDAFEDLRRFTARRHDWMFGHFGYDLVKETEPFGPSKQAPNPVGFPDLFFFIPEIILALKGDRLHIGSLRQDHAAILQEILAAPGEGIGGQGTDEAKGVGGQRKDEGDSVVRLGTDEVDDVSRRGSDEADNFGRQDLDEAAGLAGMRDELGGVERARDWSRATSSRNAGEKLFGVESGQDPLLQAAFSREEYLATVQTLREHILRGDCYEINFCQEFFGQMAGMDPLQTWVSLSKASPNPFAAYYRLEDKYLLCASPERYLRREGRTLISQPIKGTAPRVQDDPGADHAAGAGLAASAKDRSENVMVVDLVRNDLSKICLPGSVRVRELFGIYGFPQVYQMTSTVEGELAPGIDFIDAIQATFPMGSMTGAPKRRVVELIDRFERTSRGLFSGALGYVTPEGDFDFNVIIRSLFYNKTTHYLSYQVGSGITFYSDPEQEYEECLVKAEGIKKALGLRT